MMLAASVLSACEDFAPTAPFPGSLTISAIGGDRQYAAPSAAVADPLLVRVNHVGTGDPVGGITVEWRVASGSGAELIRTTSVSDDRGLATAGVRLGSAIGAYLVEAGFAGLRADPVRFTLFAVAAATIVSIQPQVAHAGDTITIAGTGFSSRASDHLVLFDGLPAQVARVTAAGLRVVVPPCVSTRTARVVVQLGSVASNPMPLDIVGREGHLVRLDPGALIGFAGGDALRCLTLTADAGAAYLLVAYNAAQQAGTDLPFQLTGMTGSAPLSNARPLFASQTLATAPSPALRWEARLRAQERELSSRIGPAPAQRPWLPGAARVAPPTLGQQRNFNVFQWEGPGRRIRAVARAVSDRALIYLDLEAPNDGFSAEELAQLAQLFDDPVYDTDTSVFGQPSDVDANGRVIVLLTPAVNRLTLPGEFGFVAGFASFCDLLPTESCWDSNVGEVLYMMVPDSAGHFGIRHRKDDVLRLLPGIMAHEFAHLIHFNERMLVRQAAAHESVWLAEALAHAAEDTVGRVLRARGQEVPASQVMRANYLRAGVYLADPGNVALPYRNTDDSLAGRGAGWLFLEYLTGRYGYGLLKQLMATTDESVLNISSRTRESWQTLVGDWFLALFADNAPELAGARIDPRYTYPNLDLRSEISSAMTNGAYPLQPRASKGDFVLSGTLAPSAPSYVVLKPDTRGVLGLGMSGPGGKALPENAQAGLWVWRLR